MKVLYLASSFLCIVLFTTEILGGLQTYWVVVSCAIAHAG